MQAASRVREEDKAHSDWAEWMGASLNTQRVLFTVVFLHLLDALIVVNLDILLYVINVHGCLLS